MTKFSSPSKGGRPKNPTSTDPSEANAGDERPFSEIRKNLNGLLRLVTLHRWAFLLPFSFVSCIAFILSLYYPRSYRAMTTFERRNDPVMVNLPMEGGLASFKYFKATMERDITSLPCMRTVVDNLGMTKDLERDKEGKFTNLASKQRDSMARSLGSRITASSVKRGIGIDLVKIVYNGPDPSIGRKLVDEVRRTYCALTMEWLLADLTKQRTYFQHEEKTARENLKKAQRAEMLMRLQNPHADPINPGMVTLRLAQLEMERRELLLRKREYVADLAMLQQTLATLNDDYDIEANANTNEGTGDGAQSFDPWAIHIERLLATMDDKIKESMSQRGLTEQHPDVKAMFAERAQIVQAGANGPPRDFQPQAVELPGASPESGMTTREVYWERNRILVRVSAQESRIKDIQISLGTNDLAIKQMEHAKSELMRTEELYSDRLAVLSRAQAEVKKIVDVLVTIDPAIKAVRENRLLQFSKNTRPSGSYLPVAPRAQVIVLLALLAGLITGTIFVVLAEIFDNVFRSSSQVAKTLGLTMLESIDEIVTTDDRRRLFVRRMVVSPLIVTGCLGLTVLSGSMAYLSLERPADYQRIAKIPHAVMNLFTEAQSTDSGG